MKKLFIIILILILNASCKNKDFFRDELGVNIKLGDELFSAKEKKSIGEVN